ncbi:MscS family membrane protein [Modicisalibacter ilicicola DSM 19980]|uniref:MscS family membrane protein n=1 Tax=Modicisalibacter ilicicola DSM 19980 TaxID=1121942 RepID=A0A1M4Z5C2_9GAMM|nr:mechanosensitive ion channel family protein [Halomonas ilicicola]SHF12997.1 MscS family membrane protein [Halomonas ilicicola DSM 19980]
MLQVLDPIEQWFQTAFGLPSWLLAPTVIVVLALIADLFLRLVLWRLISLLEKSHSRWDDVILEALRRPLWVGIWGGAIIALASLAAARLQLEWVVQHAPKALWVFVLLMLGWTGIRLVRQIKRRLMAPHARHRAKPVDASTASAISKLLGAVILAVVALAILEALGMSLSGLLAFGGLGGLVVGFALRDILANFFGGLAIHLDNPFKVGDWISSPDRELEGTVEDIGWRLTRIRTFDLRPLYIPNMLFSSIAVVNPSRMLNRRIYETVGLRYRDIAQVEGIVTRIRDMLKEHESIDQDNFMLVNFEAFGAYSLDIVIYAYTRTTDWAEHLDIKQDILLRIATIVDEAGADIAMPARELHMADSLTLDRDEPPERETSDEDSPRTKSDKRDTGASSQRAASPTRGEADDASANASNQDADA